jgi:prolyl oligopeptidase PreP (S9A serine peptidase family)
MATLITSAARALAANDPLAALKQAELIGAAIINVGLVNFLRLEQIPVATYSTTEFGSTETEESARMLSALDPYYPIRTGMPYLSVLMATDLNDTPVFSWMPAKFTARLQGATTSSHPVLLRAHADARNAAL